MTAQTRHEAGPQIPDHEMLRCVGKGAYGEVWLARNVMGTFRAVKVVYRENFENDRPFDREFDGIRKYEPVSRSHPGLVGVLHVGRHPADGYFYYVMEVADDLASGQVIDPETYRPATLGARLKKGRMPPDECVRLCLRLLAALGCLHDHGLIHRDIKPSNIIFVGGEPRIADIGLVTDAQIDATEVGTRDYMPPAPDQRGSPASDLYSLGKVLYEMSMGKAVGEFPELPTGLFEWDDAPLVMRLNDIVLRACGPEPRRRFQTVADFRAALAPLVESGSSPNDTSAGPAGGGHRGSAAPRLAVVIIGVPQAKPDAVVIQLLQERLVARGHMVHVDAQREPDLRWARELEQRIPAAQVVILVASPVSLGDELVAYAMELVRQASQGRAGSVNFVLVRASHTGPLPRKFIVHPQENEGLLWEGPDDSELVVSKVLALIEKPRN